MKTFLHICMAIMMSFSILAPAILNLVIDQDAIEFSQDVGEEESENQSNNLLEELKEKKLLSFNLVLQNVIFLSNKKKRNYRYLARHLDYAQSIILPPPELT